MNPGSLERGRKVLARVEKKQHQLDTDRTLATKTRMVWTWVRRDSSIWELEGNLVLLEPHF